MELTRKPDFGEVGELEKKSCSLYPAVMNYSLTLDFDGELYLKSDNWTDDTVVNPLCVTLPECSCPLFFDSNH